MNEKYILKGIILFVITTKLTFTQEPGCRSESQVVNGTTIDWNYLNIENYYYAYPHCIGPNDLPMTRKCVDGKFQGEPPRCVKVQESLKYCPDDFDDFKDTCCKVLSEAPESKSRCPYPNQIDITTNVNSCNNNETWYPAYRNTKYGIAEFVIQYLSERHGEILSNIIYNDTYHKCNCTVLKREHTNEMNVYAVPCEEKYKRLCSYLPLYQANNTYCKLRKKNDFCMNKSFNNTERSCIWLGNKECNKFADLNEKYQNYLFWMASSSIDSCTLSLFFTGSGLKWPKTDGPLKYTLWYYDSLINSSNIREIALMRKGWWGINQQSECRICEEDYKIAEEPQVIISRDSESILVEAINKNNMATLLTSKEPVEPPIWCFTDSIPNHLYERIPAKYRDIDYIDVGRSGHYWCEFYYLQDYSLGRSNTILIVNENIFVMKVTMSYKSDPTSSTFAYASIQMMENRFNNNSNNNPNVTLKWMKTLYLDSNIVEYLIHICTEQNDALAEVEYQYIKKNMVNFLIPGVKTMSQLYNTKYCFTSCTNTSGNILTWPTTQVGNDTASKELCFDEFGREVKRKCTGDFFEGARWNVVTEKCIERSTSKNTEDLEALLRNETNPEIIKDKLLNITENSEEFTSTDFHLTAMIIQKIVNDTEISELTEIIDKIMKTDLDAIKEAQTNFNTSDIFLKNVDYVFLKEKLKYKKEKFYSENLNSFVYNVSKYELYGMALIKKETYKIIEINQEISSSEIASMAGLEMAFYIPKGLLKEIKKITDPTIIANVFMTSNFFIDLTHGLTSAAKNFGILLPENNLLNLTKYPIELYYKASFKSSLPCGFWNYKEETQGFWEIERMSVVLNNSIHLCYFDHVTHFGLLIMNSEDYVYDGLSIIVLSIIGCALSFIGVLGIFITAIIFREWRKKKSNVIILNYATVSLTQILFLFASYYIPDEYNEGYSCKLIGIILHYTTISQFCWMFVFGLLLYRRYLKVFDGSQNEVLVLLKASVFSYSVPFIPILIFIICFDTYYEKPASGLCYPRDKGLMYTVLLPILIIVVANILVLTRISFELFRRGEYAIKKDMFVYKIRLIVLLFFLLGITWTFGILAQLFKSTFLLFLFCLTASYQCFIIFIFFIVLNKQVRKMYNNLYKKLLIDTRLSKTTDFSSY